MLNVKKKINKILVKKFKKNFKEKNQKNKNQI